ncbi:hypothetical protein V8C86DRAFT_972690 [Haematococcus lacustris]
MLVLLRVLIWSTLAVDSKAQQQSSLVPQNNASPRVFCRSQVLPAQPIFALFAQHNSSRDCFHRAYYNLTSRTGRTVPQGGCQFAPSSHAAAAAGSTRSASCAS